jgi:RNA-directed DNA polymerase
MTGKSSPPNIQEIQKALSDKATRDQEHRFRDLYRTMYNPLWIETAYKHIRNNKGSRTAGVDGVTRAKWEENLDNNLKRLVEEIKTEQFKPLPVKRRL